MESFKYLWKCGVAKSDLSCILLGGGNIRIGFSHRTQKKTTQSTTHDCFHNLFSNGSRFFEKNAGPTKFLAAQDSRIIGLHPFICEMVG